MDACPRVDMTSSGEEDVLDVGEPLYEQLPTLPDPGPKQPTQNVAQNLSAENSNSDNNQPSKQQPTITPKGVMVYRDVTPQRFIPPLERASNVLRSKSTRTLDKKQSSSKFGQDVDMIDDETEGVDSDVQLAKKIARDFDDDMFGGSKRKSGCRPSEYLWGPADWVPSLQRKSNVLLVESRNQPGYWYKFRACAPDKLKYGNRSAVGDRYRCLRCSRVKQDGKWRRHSDYDRAGIDYEPGRGPTVLVRGDYVYGFADDGHTVFCQPVPRSEIDEYKLRREMIDDAARGLHPKDVVVKHWGAIEALEHLEPHRLADSVSASLWIHYKEAIGEPIPPSRRNITKYGGHLSGQKPPVVKQVESRKLDVDGNVDSNDGQPGASSARGGAVVRNVSSQTDEYRFGAVSAASSKLAFIARPQPSDAEILGVTLASAVREGKSVPALRGRGNPLWDQVRQALSDYSGEVGRLRRARTLYGPMASRLGADEVHLPPGNGAAAHEQRIDEVRAKLAQIREEKRQRRQPQQ